jgi:hypothetical protein
VKGTKKNWRYEPHTSNDNPDAEEVRDLQDDLKEHVIVYRRVSSPLAVMTRWSLEMQRGRRQSKDRENESGGRIERGVMLVR